MLPKYYQQPVCKQCNSTRLLFDAQVKWSLEAQGYALTRVSGQHVYCEDCDEEVKVVWEEGASLPQHVEMPTSGWPDFAGWIAQDLDGQWAWFKEKPETGEKRWITGIGEWMKPGVDYDFIDIDEDHRREQNPDWKDTLVRLPDSDPDPRDRCNWED